MIPDAVVLFAEAYSATKEALTVTESCRRWLAANPDGTAAILVARNSRGSEIVKFLRQSGVPFVENLNSTSSTRAVVGALSRVMGYLADPKSAAKLAEVYRVWRRDERDDPAAVAEIKAKADALKTEWQECGRPGRAAPGRLARRHARRTRRRPDITGTCAIFASELASGCARRKCPSISCF